MGLADILDRRKRKIEYYNDDIRVLRNFVEYEDNETLRYIIYELEVLDRTGELRHFYKAIKLARIIRLPKNAKESLALMDMHAQVLSGVWEQGINLITIIANMIKPIPLGLMFCYGIQGVAEDLNTAKRIADNDYAALVGLLQGTYRTLEFRLLNYEEVEWIREKMYSMKHLSVVRGLPKPRQGGADAGNKNIGGANVNPQSHETTEEFIAGMSDREYVVQILSTPVSDSALRSWLTKTAREITKWQGQLTGQKAMNFGISLPMMYMANLGASEGWSHSYTDAETVGAAETHTEGTSFTESVSTTHTTTSSRSLSVSESASQNQSQSASSGISASDSISSSESASVSATRGVSENVSETDTAGTSQSIGQSASISHTEGESASVSESHTEGSSYSYNESESSSSSHSKGVNQSYGTTQSRSTSTGTNTSQTVGSSRSVSSGTNQSTTLGTSRSSSVGGGTNWSQSTGRDRSYGTNVSGSIGGGVIPASISAGSSYSVGSSSSRSYGGNTSYSNTTGTSSSVTTGRSTSETFSNNTSNTVGTSHSVTTGSSISETRGTSESWTTTEGVSRGQSWGANVSDSITHSRGVNSSVSWSEGINASESVSSSHSVSRGIGTNASRGVSASVGTGTSSSVGTNHSVGVSQGTGTSQGVSYSESHSSSVGTTRGYSKGTSVSDSVSHNWGRSQGTSTGYSGSFSQATSATMGVGPSLSYSKSFQWLDQEVQNIITLLEFQNERLMKALNGNGAFFTDVYIATPDEETKATAQALAKSAWYDENALICPLQVLDLDPEEQSHLLYHFNAFSADTTLEGIAGDIESYKYTTILLPDEYAAYTHLPRISEGGVYADVSDIPKFAVPSMRKGEIYMGKILSGERYTQTWGYETPYDYRISSDEIMHGFFTGESRSGKTVAATRFIAEVANKVRRKGGKRMRIVCMDPKQDWRVLARFVEPERFHFYSLGNPEFLPINLNICKIPKNVYPQQWIDGIIEIYCRAYGLGERGKSVLSETFFELYEEAGVFVPNWREVAPERSKQVTLPRIYERMLQKKLDLEDPKKSGRGRVGNDVRDAYARVLDRLQVFGRSFSIETQLFGREDGMGVDDLIGKDDVVVLESYGLESTFKNFIFGVITSGFFKYAQAHEGGFKAPDQYETILVIEEANEVLTGQDSADKNRNDPLPGQSEFEKILDQAAGLGLFIFSITQKIASMPSSVIANSGLVFCGKISRKEDIETVVRKIGREERYDDRDLVKWFPRSPIGWFVCRSSRNFDFKEVEPVLVKIQPLDLDPPTNAELKDIMTLKKVLQRVEK